MRAAVKALLEEVFDEQTDFELRPERVQATLERLQHSTFANASEVTLVATLHGVTIGSAELQLPMACDRPARRAGGSARRGRQRRPTASAARAT